MTLIFELACCLLLVPKETDEHVHGATNLTSQANAGGSDVWNHQKDKSDGGNYTISMDDLIDM